MKRLIYSIVLTLFCTVSYAQTVVSGTVKDSRGEAVIGAVVMVDGTTNAAVTDAAGGWKLQVNGSSVKLTASCLGYRNESVTTEVRSTIDFILQEDNEQLTEVVVVGYGAMRRSDLTGSVTSVKIDEDTAAKSSSLDQMLQGRAAGVQVISSSAAPDAGVNIRVRGMTSLTGSSEPLYVVDGVIMTSVDGSMLSYGTDNSGADEATNGLMGINPQDIASIEILKDASATAIYGSEGANGVILITTKMGVKEKPTVRFSAGVDLVTLHKRMDVLSFDEYVSYLESNTLNNGSKTILKRIYENPATHEGLLVTPIDWQDYSFQPSLRQRWYFSVSGRPKTLNYSFSMGLNNSNGIVRSTGVKNYTIRLNVDKTFNKKVKVGAKVNFSYIDSRSMQGASSSRQLASTSMMRSILVSKPYLKGAGTEADEDEDEDWENADENFKSTPNNWIADAYNLRQEYRVTPNFFLEWKLLPWLTYKISAGGDYHFSEKTKWKGASINRTTGGATASIAEGEALRWNLDNMLMFKKNWGDHNLSGTIGLTTDNRFSKTQNILGYNIAQYDLKADNISSAPNAMFSYNETKVNTISYLLRAIYNYKDRYVLTSTFRVDGSCKFQGKNVYSSFPSFAAAWRINQEPWFHSRTISTAKLRLGWGQVGNSAVSSYQTFVTYGNTQYASHSESSESGYAVAIFPKNIANPELKWETTEQWNAGLDLGLWRGRLALSVDAYDKYTFDLLNQKSIPITSGFSTTWVNQGIIRNRGLEFSLDAVPVKTKKLEWAVNGNISFNRNRIVNIGTDSVGKEVFLSPDDPREVNYYLGSNIGNGRYLNCPGNIFIEGQPIGLFYGYATDGIVRDGQTGASFSAGNTLGPGYIKYVDCNADGYIDTDDRCVIGDPNPDFTFGFGTTLSWGNLSLSLAFNGSYGNDVLNSNLNQLWDTGYDSMPNILRKAYYEAWTPERQDSRFPALGCYSQSDSQVINDTLIEDGSYLRLANVSLSYRIPFKKFVVKSINTGISVQNCFVWTRYSGWDPEVNSFGSDMTRIGIDSGSYPASRTFCFDLKFIF